MPQPPAPEKPPFDVSGIDQPPPPQFDVSELEQTLKPPAGSDQDVLLQNLRDAATGAWIPSVRRFVTGVGQGGLQSVAGLDRMLYGGYRALGGPPDPRFESTVGGMERAATPTSPEAQVGKAGEQIGEFFLTGNLMTDAATLVQAGPRLRLLGYPRLVARYGQAAVEGALQGMGAGTTAALHGESPTAPALFSTATPFLPPTVAQLKPWLVSSARRNLVTLFGEPLADDVLRATRTGRQLTRAARDAFILRVRPTWGQWDRATSLAKGEAADALEWTLAGPTGDIPIPIAEFNQAIDDSIARASRLVPVGPNGQPLQGQAAVAALSGQTPASFTMRPNDPDLVAALKALKDQFAGETHIPARDLHAIKRKFDSVVFGAGSGRATSQTIQEMTARSLADASYTAANALREVFSKEAPTIADIDQVFSRTKRLHDYVVGALNQAKGTGKTLTEQLLPQTGHQMARAGVANLLGSGVGYYWAGPPGGIAGAVLGTTVARLLSTALASPLWRAMPAQAKNDLAQMIVNGNVDGIRRMVTPLIAGTLKRRPSATGDSMAPASQGAAGAPAQSLLANEPAGHRYTLSDGSQWDKLPDGTIRPSAVR